MNEIARERAYSFLKPEHQQRILSAYEDFEDVTGFAAVVTLNEVAGQGHSLSIPLYVKRSSDKGNANHDERPLSELWADWEREGDVFWQQMDALVGTLDGLLDEVSDG